MLESFFSETSDSRASTIKMPDSMADWSDFLINQLLRQNPQLSGKDIRVHYEHENADMRTATGTLKIRGVDEQKLMDVPFVVRMGLLSPLDVFYPEDSRDPLPLTENRTREAMFQARAFGRIAPRPVRGSMTDDGYENTSPYTGIGSTPFPSNTKMAQLRTRLEDGLVTPLQSILDDVSPLAPREAYRFLEKEANTPTGRVSFRALASYAGLRDSFEKMATHAAHAMPTERYPMEGHDRLQMAYIVKEGANHFTLYGYSARGDLTKVGGLTDDKVKNVLSSLGASNADDQLNGIYRLGETVLVHPDHTKRPVVEDRAVDEVKTSWHEAPSKKTLHVQVYRPVSKTLLQGLLLGNVMSLEGGDSGQKLFVKAEAGFAYQPNMAVDVLDGSLSRGPRQELVAGVPEEGKYATIVWSNEDVNHGEITALPPFRILAMEKDVFDDRFSWADVVFFDSEEVVRLLRTYSNHIIRPTLYKKQTPEPTAPFGGMRMQFVRDIDVTGRHPNYIVPRNAVMIDLGEPFDVAEDTTTIHEEEIAKTAACTWPIRVSHTSQGFSVRTQDPAVGIRKVAAHWGFPPDELTATQAQAVLCAAGLSKEASERLIQHALEWSAAYARIAPKQEEHAAFFEKRAEQLKGVLSEIDKTQAFLQKQSLLKIAASMPNSSSAANILSLRLLSMDTLRAFASRAGDLKKTLSFLCTLLLTKRIEDSLEVEEEDLISAIRSIDNVLDSLKKINGMLSTKVE